MRVDRRTRNKVALMAKTGRPRNVQVPQRTMASTLAPLDCLQEPVPDIRPPPRTAIEAEQRFLSDVADLWREEAKFRRWDTSVLLDASNLARWLVATLPVCDPALIRDFDAAYRIVTDDAFEAWDRLRQSIGFDYHPATASCHLTELIRIARKSANAKTGRPYRMRLNLTQLEGI
jgi:hypothetical protein